jgi:hypothetical protein
MARYMTSSTLIDSVVSRAMLPVNQVTFQDVDFLRFATEELDMAIIPFVLQYHEDYFLTYVDIPLEDGRNKYTIPYRAIGNKLRDVAFVDVGGAIFEMTRITIDDISYYQYGGGNAFTSTGFRVFYIQNNEIVLLPEAMSNPTGSLRVSYYIRPNQLVDESRVATVTSVNPSTGEIGVSSVPSNITLGINLDILQTRSPHKCLTTDIMATNIDTVNKIITFDPTQLPYQLAVGDQIATAEESCIPQIPTDLHSMLAQRVACRCLEALGDQQGLQAANTKLAEMEQKGASLIDDRVEGAPLKINNRHSFLNRTKSSFRR